jgi:multidrug efflux pump subunit AcrA (membrane-fusion protein)
VIERPSPKSSIGQLIARPRRAVRPRLLAGGGLVVVAALVIGGVAMADGSSSSASYRTAVVSEQSVQQILDAVAVVQPVRQASVAFPVSGTVQTVSVHVGDQVTTGQPLAALSTASLAAALTSKQAALAQAQLNLQKALDGQNPGVSSGSGGGSGGSVTTSAAGTAIAFDTGPSGTSGASAGAPSAADLQAAEQAVLDDQKQVDADLSAAQAAMANSSNVCAAVSQSTSTTVNPSDAAACQKALQTVLDDQKKVATDQAALADASKHLNTLLDQMASSAGSSTSTTVPNGATGASGGGRSSSSAGAGASSAAGASRSSSTSRSSAPSAEDLVAYQRAVDAATDAVAVAQQAVDQATIVSPISGTVEAVNLSPADSVSAGSSTANIVVMGTGGYEVTTNVSVDQLSKVKVGQAATVHPDGSSKPMDGKVVSIGVAGTTSSTTGSTVYPVTVGLTGDGTGLNNGATASVDIVTASTTKGLAVPTSAVTTLAGRHMVTVLAGGKTTVTPVSIGAVGPTWTAVASGLQAGQKVVLANLNQALPGSATSASSSSTGNATLDRLISQFRQGGGAGAGGGAGGLRTRTAGG